MDANPFESPTADPRGPRDDESGLPKTAWPIILAWEKPRLVYLAWLSAVSLSVLAGIGLDELPLGEPWFWANLVAGFVGANVCFTAGHALELVLAWLGMPPGPRRWVRGSVFGLGTLFSTLLAILAIAFPLTH
ncbi:MAG: hypothetical protein AAGB00_04565 [Planctomycetota bacterium]